MAKRKMPSLNVEESEGVVIGPIVAEETIAETLKPVVGIVSGCNKLYVRKQPFKSAADISMIDAGTKVTIEIDKSTTDWYRVRTESGVNGYCMKKFITVE